MHEPARKTSPIFYGGRHLLAISMNPSLTATEKHVLHELASMMDFSKDFQEGRTIEIDELILRTSLSRRTIFRTLNTLQERCYITRARRRSKDRKEPLPSQFAISRRVFDEYYEREVNAGKVVSLFD